MTFQGTTGSTGSTGTTVSTGTTGTTGTTAHGGSTSTGSSNSTLLGVAGPESIHAIKSSPSKTVLLVEIIVPLSVGIAVFSSIALLFLYKRKKAKRNYQFDRSSHFQYHLPDPVLQTKPQRRTSTIQMKLVQKCHRTK